MKTYFNFILAALLLFGLSILQAQTGLDTVTTVDIPDPISIDTELTGFLNWYNALYGAIVILMGFLHNWIPVLTAVSEKWVRVALAGVIVAIIFLLNGVGDGLSLAFTFLSAVGIYDIFLKRAGLKSPPIINLGVWPRKSSV